tara:strand:+ start:8824 stop:10176 length:1353 start_codon:yes stop_codon:yes gene_type:complete
MYLTAIMKSLFQYILLVTFLFCLGCNTTNDLDLLELDNTLPLVHISTLGNKILDEPKIDAFLEITVNNTIAFSGKIAIEIRGSSSQQFPKKSYSIETRNDENADLDVSLLGLPEEEDWILHGPFSDKTLIRNKFMYDLSRSIGNYASRTVFVELSINEENKGLYILMEKLKRDKNRIDINKLNPGENTGEDVTGGYILKIDRAVENNPDASFKSSYPPPFATRGQQVHFVFEEPSPEEITTEQRDYISDYVASFEDALHSENFKDPVSGYLSYIDISSFIDFFIFNELANNVDSYRLSSYMTKDKNEKLKMGPIWDFNYALGNVDFCNAGSTDIWAYTFNERCGNHNQQVPFWWSRFMEDPIFVHKIKERWSELRSTSFSESNFNEMIDNYTALLNTTKGEQRNFEVWDILGTDIHPNNFVGETHSEEIEYLKSWLASRLNWLDGSIQNL